MARTTPETLEGLESAHISSLQHLHTLSQGLRWANGPRDNV